MIFVAKPPLGLAHDFILTPFCVFVKTEFATVIFATPSSFKLCPKLPMLHARYDKNKSEVIISYWLISQ